GAARYPQPGRDLGAAAANPRRGRDRGRRGRAVGALSHPRAARHRRGGRPGARRPPRQPDHGRLRRGPRTRRAGGAGPAALAGDAPASGGDGTGPGAVAGHRSDRPAVTWATPRTVWRMPGPGCPRGFAFRAVRSDVSASNRENTEGPDAAHAGDAALSLAGPRPGKCPLALFVTSPASAATPVVHHPPQAATT